MRVLSLLPGLLLTTLVWSASLDGKQVMGIIEIVKIYPEGLVIHAKLDTGADSTSLHARSIRMIERDGVPWVAFEVDEGSPRPMQFERPLVRHVVIRRGQGVKQRRPVVEMRVCMGSIERDVHVSLVDRGDFNHPMLIGRNFMVGGVIVDPALELTTAPVCPSGRKP